MLFLPFRRTLFTSVPNLLTLPSFDVGVFRYALYFLKFFTTLFLKEVASLRDLLSMGAQNNPAALVEFPMKVQNSVFRCVKSRTLQ